MHPGGELLWPAAGMAIGFGEGFVIALRDLLACIALDQPATPSFLDGLRAAEVVAAALASSLDRSWQQVEPLEASSGP